MALSHGLLKGQMRDILAFFSQAPVLHVWARTFISHMFGRQNRLKDFKRTETRHEPNVASLSYSMSREER
jgi:hypothetical protein